MSMSSGGGSVKWQHVSEDLVPVNISCIQETPESIFHISAYNSQVDKILDVRLVQPGELCDSLDRIEIDQLLPIVELCRNSHRPGVGMFRLLEGSDDQRHVGLEFHVAHRCETVPRLLRKSDCGM